MPLFEEWLGRRRVMEDTVAPERARKMAATLDQDPESFVDGAPLPWGWHWMLFHEPVRRSALADDGHEARGDFLPPVPLPRRMWAGGRLRFLRALSIGSTVERTSTVRSIEMKDGRSGPLAFVTVEHRIADVQGVVVEEEQHLVYLERPVGAWSPPPRIDSPGVGATPGGCEPRDVRSLGRFSADEVTLFRFSALTFNGHRIHYDPRFANEVEGYPDIVVHGPLIALLLLGAGRRWLNDHGSGVPDAAAMSFSYRALQPLFRAEPIELRGMGWTGADASGVELWGEHAERGMVMRAELR